MGGKQSALFFRTWKHSLPVCPLFPGWPWLLLLLVPFTASAQQNQHLTSDPQVLRKAAPPLLQAAYTQPTETYRVLTTNQAAFRQWLARHLPAARIAGPATGNAVVTVQQLAPGQLPQLLSAPGVIFVDVANRKAYPELALSHADLTVNHITALHRYFPALTGAGFTASIKEQPFDTTDIDLKGRIVKNPVFNQPPSTHATTIATLIGGAGNTAPTGRGVARQARLTASDFAELMPDEGAALLASGVTVQNHSYGVGAVENYYGLEAQAYDQQGSRHPQLVHVFSAGNAGPQAGTAGPYAGLSGWANLTGQFKMSKNTLSVGATDLLGQPGSLSSRGPAYDGRVKPEVVAYGENGTSEAAALVAGLALLAQQAYRDQHNGVLPPAALVKAALINSADDLGRPGVDFETGYGQSDALGTIQTLQEGRFFTGTVSQGQSRTFVLQVPAGTRAVKVTLVWHDPAAAANAGQALVNDLDLTFTHPASGQFWQPWVLSAYPHPDSLRLLPRRRADRLNNVEQVTLAGPQAGAYRLQVQGYQVPQGPQDFSLAYEFESGLSWQYPTRDDQLLPGRAQRLRWQGPAADAAATGRMEYRLGTQGTWQLLDEQVPLAAGSYEWLTPDTVGLAQVRLSTPGQTLSSEVFLLAPQLPLQVGYNCEEDFMLSWPAVQPASAYQVYRLGRLYLEPYTQTTDTVLVVSKTADPPTFYAVAPIIGDLTGRPGHALHYARSGSVCYVQSFLPRQLVSDTVMFDALLSTTHQLSSIQWQRLEKGVFSTIQTITPVASTQYVLTDQAPRPGRNEYRLLLTTSDGRQVLSPIEFMFYAPADFLLIYPNPVAAGKDLELVLAGDEAADLVIYDSIGREVARPRQSGAIKLLSTKGLQPGVFFVRALTVSGRYVTKRLVVF